MIISYMRLCWVMFHIFTDHHGKWMKIVSYFGYIIDWTSKQMNSAAEDSKTRSGILPGELSLRLSLGSVRDGGVEFFFGTTWVLLIFQINRYIPINIPIHIPTVGYHIYIFHKLNIYPTEWSTFDFRRGSDQSGQSWVCQNMVDLHLHLWENDVQKPVELFFFIPSMFKAKQQRYLWSCSWGCCSTKKWWYFTIVVGSAYPTYSQLVEVKIYCRSYGYQASGCWPSCNWWTRALNWCPISATLGWGQHVEPVEPEDWWRTCGIQL